MGYVNAKNMKHGMCAWTTDLTVRATTAFRDTVGKDVLGGTIETTVNTPDTTYTYPSLELVVSSTDPGQAVREAAEAYIKDVPTRATITAAQLNTLLTDGVTTNDPIIVEVRSATDYAKGHIPGSINIPYKEIAKPANLAKLDPTRDIVVYCYTGHTGGVATTILNILGYKAKNLKFGIMSWTQDATVRTALPYGPADQHSFATTSGANP
jgi:rhodanese-related sulfurtransferase